MRCADAGSQRGAAVILALLSVALAAGLTAALIGDFGRSLDSVAGRQDQAQARLLARGAVDWARNVLADDFKRTNVDHANEMWAVRVPPTPVGDGEVGGEIHDRSGLFNLNNLVPDGKADPLALAQLERLLATLGVAPADTNRLAQALVDWIGSSTTAKEKNGIASSGLRETSGANGSLLDAAELRLVAGFDAALVDRLTPFVTALPAPTRINVNTAPAEVLAAIVTDLELNDARILVAERERAWFRDLADFSARLPSGTQPGATALDVRSRHFAVIGRSGFGSAVVRMEVLLDRRETWPTILWQRIL